MALLILSIMCLCLIGCKPAQAGHNPYGNPASPPTPPSNVTSSPFPGDASVLRDPLNSFAFQLYRNILAANPAASSANLFYSPTSIVSALMLVYAGAKGNTKMELTTAFNLRNQLNQGVDILGSFQSVIGLFRPGPVINGTVAYDLSLANRAYIEQTLDVFASYISTITAKLNSTVGLVDFINNAEAARSDINQWVAQQTNNKITDLLAAGSVDRSTRLVLVNAIYFKAAWADIFDERLTGKGQFTNLDGSTSQVDMMSKSEEMLTYFDSSAAVNVNLGLPAFQMVSIPYKSNRLSLLVFLPRDVSGLTQLEASFSSAAPLNAILKAARNESINNLNLPKFTIKSTLEPKNALQSIGINKAFDEKQADLTGISAAKPLFVSDIIHQSFIGKLF